MQRAKTVEAYIASKPEWSEGLSALREVALSTGMEEVIKWGAPCYTHGGRNIISLAGFKGYFGLWFHDCEGLEDPDGVLQQAKGGKSESMRQWRFETTKDIKKRALKAYLKRAMTLSEAPRKPRKKTAAPTDLPPELDAALAKAKGARAAFDALTPGRQRDYAEHIASAKREATKLSRIEKIVPMIQAGIGLHDKYRNC
jgi:uncharacterized protein YdeI (YjbR/CyaY-like superfamily)